MWKSPHQNGVAQFSHTALIAEVFQPAPSEGAAESEKVGQVKAGPGSAKRLIGGAVRLRRIEGEEFESRGVRRAVESL